MLLRRALFSADVAGRRLPPLAAKMSHPLLRVAVRSMSRVGKLPIKVPDSVTVSVEDIDLMTLPARHTPSPQRLKRMMQVRPSKESFAAYGQPRRVHIKGPLGEQAVDVHSIVNVEQEQGSLRVSTQCGGESKLGRTMWGSTRGYLDNAVRGVSQGFRKELELHGVGFRAAVEQRIFHGKQLGHFYDGNSGEKNTVLVMRIGFSHEVIMPIPTKLKVTTPTQTSIIVFGDDKQQVGLLAQRIRLKRKPDAYKGKGIRYKGEIVKLKQGKRK